MPYKQGPICSVLRLINRFPQADLAPFIMSSSQTHKAVATFAPRIPLRLIDVPTVTPTGNEVRVKVEWTASTPLDLHRADGGLLVTHPQVMGGGAAGAVVQVGEGVKRLKVGDKVFGFTWRSQQEKAHQIYITAPENLFAIVSIRSLP